MNKRAPLNQDDIGTLLALAAILFGGWLRFYPALQTDFPINDGGLFYMMTSAVQENLFHPPLYINYNGLQIPFAYPPLAFYVTAILGKALNVPLIVFFRILPAVVITGTIPAFYLLAKNFLTSNLEAGLATLIFALTPRSITWFIMGGGLTRSFGLLFLILASTYIYRAFWTGKTQDTILGGVFSALVILSHPEAAFHTMAIGLLFLIFKGRTKQGLISAALIGLLALLSSGIWWIQVISRFGLTPFLSAAQTGLNEAFGVLYAVVQFSEEPYITFIMVFAFLGIVLEIIRHEYLLPAWYILPFLIETRSARNVAIIPLALLAAIGLMEMIKLLARLESQLRTRAIENAPQARVTAVFLIFLTVYGIIGTSLNGMELATQTVTRSNREAFDWIAHNTAPSSRFLVITGETELLRDWTQEWFPALTGRISETTIQGYEWLGTKNFLDRMTAFQEIQQCTTSKSPLGCIQTASSEKDIPHDYIYVAENTSSLNATRPTRENLINELLDDGHYKLVYRTDDASIFKTTR